MVYAPWCFHLHSIIATQISIENLTVVFELVSSLVGGCGLGRRLRMVRLAQGEPADSKSKLGQLSPSRMQQSVFKKVGVCF